MKLEGVIHCERQAMHEAIYKRGYNAALDDVKQVLSEVSRDYAGAHVNAGTVTGSVRRMIHEQLDERPED